MQTNCIKQLISIQRNLENNNLLYDNFLCRKHMFILSGALQEMYGVKIALSLLLFKYNNNNCIVNFPTVSFP